MPDAVARGIVESRLRDLARIIEQGGSTVGVNASTALPEI